MASLERGEKIFGPSKPCISTKRPREQQQQEKEVKKANNASSEKKKSVKWKDQENDVTKEKEKGGGKNVDAVRKEQQEEKEAASKPSYKLEDTEKAAPNNEKEKKNARLRKTKEKTSGSEEKRKEKRKKMVDSDCDSNPKETSDIAALKLRGGHLQNRFLSEADSKVESVDVIPNRSYEDKLDHSKIMPFGIDRVGEPVKLQHQKEIKRGEKDKSVREAMFEKVVTPSDVGKVNRLVIPKHHAEKYFPLDTNANDKGSLLNFEDNTGKAWRFRYSYGSQRYMLTKGWSRFVKEKKLDAGDIVSFQRATDAQNAERLFISWKRQPCALQIQPVVCCEGGTSKGEMIKQFNKERTNVMNNFKNEVIDEYRKKLNQLEECIINVVREAKHGSSNNRECDDFWFSSNEMIQRLSSFKSKELPPLSSSEMEEFEHKCREREAIVLEANIKCLALMQEELQLMKAKIQAPVSGGS